jgi:hypothetical protein
MLDSVSPVLLSFHRRFFAGNLAEKKRKKSGRRKKGVNLIWVALTVAVLTAGGDRMLRFWDVATGRPTRRVQLQGKAPSTPPSPRGPGIILGICNGLRSSKLAGHLHCFRDQAVE